ncbi:uncharacterized protein LOC110038757 [Phalaenopsis equestris]|uniref:uncharacterized protein LOC110038757 n=1 Tax=Phalaenopsis equestris TaxID=78828 RepID=UPI0009E38C9F|nr:uncharacterized protein LOC110038757 [Phalaenopsis equestris]
MNSMQQSSALKSELTIKALYFLIKSLLWIISAVSEPHPLFSAASAGVVAVLYLPCRYLSIFFSPVLLSTLGLLFTLLRFGSAPTPPPLPSAPPETDSKQMKLSPEVERPLLSLTQNHVFCKPSLEWGGWGCPLKTIYEEYDWEEEETYERSLEYSESRLPGFDVLGYSYSDMEAADSPGSICFLWEEEAEELIEIGVEEDNMFEIDLSASA